MKPGLRRVFFFVYTIFFVIVTPILIVVSLGYNVDLKNLELMKTLKVGVETLPRNGSVFYNNKEIFKTPGEIKILDDQVVNLSVQKNDYQFEDFVFWSSQEKNTVVEIENLAFLPNQGQTIDTFDSFEDVSILSDGYVLLEKDQDYYIQEFDFKGLVGEKEKINNSSKSIITDGKWDRLDSGFYFKKDQQLVLYFDVVLDGWEIYSFQSLGIQVESLELFDDQNLLLLDDRKTLWVFNIVNNNLRFKSSRVNGIDNTESPNRVWVNKDGGLYFFDKKSKIEDLDIAQENLYLDDIFNYIPKDVESSYFEVANVGQGIVVLADERINYIPDFNKNRWVYIADNVANLGTFNRNVYWLDNESVLWYYNFLNEDIDRIGTIDLDGGLDLVEFEYFSFWNRLFIYSENSVYSIWIDQDLSNENILKYSINEWIQDSKCQDEIIEKNQLCIKDGELIKYNNLSNF